MQLFTSPADTIDGMGAAVRRRELTCVALLERCLDSIDQFEDQVKAWVLIDREGARAHAKVLDEELRAGRDRGPLHGMPFGIKDIVDVEGWPTACGSKQWGNRIAPRDAIIVQRLRAAGAVILGKTVTTQYASFDPPVTRNPWNLERTPGGSSSGSAAAVAYGGCVASIGSQTGGSLTRPASYCGVATCKPTHGVCPDDGFLPLAPSMDHPGPIARSVRDVARVLDVIGDNCHVSLGSNESVAMPSLARFRSWFDGMASADVVQALDQSIGRLKSAGTPVPDVVAPDSFNEVTRRHRTIMAVEAAAFHEERLTNHPDEYLPRITELLREGLATLAPEYARCQTDRRQLASTLVRLFNQYDAILAPATTCAAPDSSTTGDPAFNSPWSYVGFPVVSFATGLNSAGLPLGIQLIGAPHTEPRLFRAAAWCENVLQRPV